RRHSRFHEQIRAGVEQQGDREGNGVFHPRFLSCSGRTKANQGRIVGSSGDPSKIAGWLRYSGS
ncbi:MAG: hypothetical protein ACYSVY_10465, partial [Planctomycetota bacterium]